MSVVLVAGEYAAADDSEDTILAAMALGAVVKAWGDPRGFSFRVDMIDGKAEVTVRRQLEHRTAEVVEGSLRLDFQQISRWLELIGKVQELRKAMLSA